MYDKIFEDFNTIKEHSERNGNNYFEESAVFELLESLYPQHGSAMAIQTIIDMLDAQRIRDSKCTTNNSVVETDSSENSSSDRNENDNDIIEIEVPKKIHPVIDLTENSTESDEAVIIEKFENKHTIENIEINSDSNIETYDSEASCNEIHSFSDSDISKYFNEDSNLTSDDLIRSNSEKQLLNYLAILDQPNQMNQLEGEQSNNNSVDVSEMLEENNNDPNNNFDEENADANLTVDNDSNVSNTFDEIEPPTVMHKLFDRLLESVPIPGCSKETSPNSVTNIDNMDGPHYDFFNPVPGCSKDLDISHNTKLSKTNDESIEKDILCIQEIIPWAASHKIRSLLLKYNCLPERKQLTLSKLMRKESKRMKTQAVKRKSNDNFEIESKMPKVDAFNDVDDLLDMPHNLRFNNVLCNESSNDSQSSKPSGHIDSTHNIDQTLQESDTAEFSKLHLEKNRIRFDSDVNSSLIAQDSDMPVFSKASSSVPATNHTVKKERNETVVSGLLQEQKHLEMLNGTNRNEKSVSSSSTNLFRPPVNEPFFPNGNNFQFPPNNNIFNDQIKNETIERWVKEEADNTLNDIPEMSGLFNDDPKSLSSPNKDRIVIQPPKLLLQNRASVVNPIVAARPQKSNYMRPAILKFNNTQHNSHNIVVPEQKNIVNTNLKKPSQVFVNYNARQNDYIPPALNVVQKQTPVPNLIQLPPGTVVHQNPAHRKLSTVIKYRATNHDAKDKSHNVIRMHRPANVQKQLEKVETIVKPVLKVQSIPLVNDPVALPGTSGLNFSASTSASSDIPHQSIYNKLRSIFPDVESSYIKQICINPPNVNNTVDKAYVLDALIEHLLTEGSNHLRPVEYVIDQPNIASVSVDEKYEYLLGIFPDADPTYIREFVVKNTSEQDFEQFIQQKLESRDYPTKEQYMARIKITEQIKQYTTDLNIEKFLELFPDPFKHFEDASRKCLYHPIGMEFLKSLFARNKVTTISHYYKKNHHILSLTARALTELGSDMKSKRVSVEMPTEDIPLLQEMAFIKNKQNITNHLNMLKTKEERLFEELKTQNLLLTCQCCFNDECMPIKSAECNDGHLFCHECIIRGTESALADAEAHVRCFTECTNEFSLATLQKVLPPTKFSALLQKRQMAEVIAAGMDGLVSCPFCHFSSIPPPEDKVFKCLNPDCMKETCKMCKELNHVPLKCDEVIKTDKARRIIEEKMTEALVRTCYQCKKQFYKEDGCNKMKCTCGALMCYLCSKPIKGYDHFNAQGGANTHLCPLWSDDAVINAKAVIKVAEDVKKVLLRHNPNLNIDTDALLPKIPPKTSGPHDHIANANQLPEHIMRIANPAPR